jgi:hypothetical protein
MKNPTLNLFLLFFILIVVGILYKRYETKLNSMENEENNQLIQDYLLENVTLEKSKKPILWIYVPHEYNARNWSSFGSRSSFDVNQPYLYLTVKSIIRMCSSSFTICIIDDNSFERLLDNWQLNLSRIPEPVRENVIKLGVMKLLYKYGGLLCPISFLCMRDLISLYNQGISQNKMFLCETLDENITSTSFTFYPNMMFSGSPKENTILGQFINFLERTISTDYTAESKFLGSYDRWCEARIKSNEMNLISGRLIGTKTISDQAIRIEDLMGNTYLKLDDTTYGILIPAKDLLNRRKYEWFTRMSEQQVMESNIIIGNYLLLSAAPQDQQGLLEPFKQKTDWVGFWKTPLYDGLYGLKPNFLGDNLMKVKYPGR